MIDKKTEADLVTIKGYDDCVIGVCNRIHQETIIAYDMQKFVEKTMELHDLCEKGAMNYIEQSVLKDWCGEATPCFVSVTDLSSIKQFYDEVSKPDGTRH